MATPEQIREGLKRIAKSHAPEVSNIAVVKSVNEDEATCILIDEDEQEYLDVRLRPVLNGNKSFMQIPKVGTYVLAVRVEDDDDWMVIACDEVEKFVWFVGNTKLQLDDKVHFEANGKNYADLMTRLFSVIEKGYQTNTGATIKLVMLPEFLSIKNDFKQLLK
ncbi:hypothetical protein [Chryseobacterium sp. R2A-55]|uniref:hypothetical protein n=1 Tax=Chryseobacterium sp. R2A-55 TaxID=2744445 RepID=UPI001F28DF7B|nr:hypothetical protein [Chryseobacterium sp. R2A-55]